MGFLVSVQREFSIFYEDVVVIYSSKALSAVHMEPCELSCLKVVNVSAMVLYAFSDSVLL